MGARAALILVGALVLAPGAALAHDEREITFPDGSGSVPGYRTSGPRLLVCKDDRPDFAQRVAGFAATTTSSATTGCTGTTMPAS